MVVALPETENEVQRIPQGMSCVARASRRARRRHRAFGRRAAARDGVLLSLARFMPSSTSIPAARTARLQPGVRNLAISEAAAQYGFITRPTHRARSHARSAAMSRRIQAACTALKYGLTLHNIMKLRAYTIDGELLEIGGGGLDSAGYDCSRSSRARKGCSR